MYGFDTFICSRLWCQINFSLICFGKENMDWDSILMFSRILLFI